MSAMKLLGALGLLIYGMRMMSDALQKLAGPQLRHTLGTMTTNRFTGMLTGMLVTCLVQSSSATTVMAVSFVSAGLLTLAQAISVIMGANIGTTLTAWIMSLGYNVDLTNIVFPAFFLGMVLMFKKRRRLVGDFLFGIAFMFLSLVMLSTAGRELDLAHNESVVQFFASFDTGSYLTILSFLGLGTLITCIVQSSAAVMALTILLCSTGVLPIHLGIALVMGENIGTTATANLVALGAGVPARRAALAHLVFNVFGVMWVLVVFFPLVRVVCHLSGYDLSAGGQAERLPVVLATFHTCFNVVNTFLLIGFVPQLERLVCFILPEEKKPEQEEFRLRYIESNLVQTPEIAVLQAQRETQRFAQFVQQMFGKVRTMLDTSSDKDFENLSAEVEHDEDSTDKMEISIANYLEQVSENHLSDMTKSKVRRLMREICELESIGDSCRNMSRTLVRLRESIHNFTPSQYRQVRSIMDLANEALTQMNVVMEGRKVNHDIATTLHIEDEIRQMCQWLKNDNVNAINEQEYSYAVGTIFMDMVNECGKMGGYVVNVVQARLESKMTD